MDNGFDLGALVNHLPHAHSDPLTAYQMSHYPMYYYREWCEYFEENLPECRKYMSEKEQAFYNNLPDEIVVYRGIAVPDEDYIQDNLGLSWTYEFEVAEFFANKYAKRFDKHNELVPIIMKKTVKKSDIAWIILGRDEAEVVLRK